jgi:hypothetical protein
MPNEQFEALETRQKELENNLWEPVFIDIKKWELYIVELNGKITYIK